jgi:hypothetical protein
VHPRARSVSNLPLRADHTTGVVSARSANSPGSAFTSRLRLEANPWTAISPRETVTTSGGVSWLRDEKAESRRSRPAHTASRLREVFNELQS